MKFTRPGRLTPTAGLLDQARMQVTGDCDLVENLRKQIDVGQDSAGQLDITPVVRIAAGLADCSR